ncbi:hypothetical protein N3930_26835, partial [Bacillus thuringiensis]|nr:hypothetical protein [Bacillus thuringiensis]
VEIVIDTNYQTKEEDEKLENNTSLHQAKLDKEKLVINDTIKLFFCSNSKLGIRYSLLTPNLLGLTMKVLLFIPLPPIT